MVTTRRREQQAVAVAGDGLATPPRAQPGGKGAASPLGEPSPRTPATTLPPYHASGQAGLPLPSGRVLKSALKTGRRAGPAEDEAAAAAANGEVGEEATPAVGAMTARKKRVRIESAGNMVRFYHPSATTTPNSEDAGAGSTGYCEGEPEQDSAQRRRPARVDPLSFSHYQAFMRGVRTPRQRAAKRRQPSGVPLEGFVALTATLAWMASSSLLIFVNKALMVDVGFQFPFALTALGQAASAILGFAATQLGVAPLRPPPAPRYWLTRLLPVAFCFAAALWLGNVAYLGLSVAFINMLKALTPAATLLAGVALGDGVPPLGAAASTLLIGVGTGVSTAQEAASAHFSWFSFNCFAASIAFEALRVVLVGRLLGAARFNVMEALLYIGPLTFLLLAAGAAMTEWEGLSTVGWALVCARPGDFATAAVAGFLVNLSAFYAIQATSGATFKVAGCLKNVAVVWGGVLQGDTLTPREVQGYAIALGGTALYLASGWHKRSSSASISNGGTNGGSGSAQGEGGSKKES